jgi:Haloacid dehalogenase-like hydrolase
MDVILDIEAGAAARTSPASGLTELLELIAACDVRAPHSSRPKLQYVTPHTRPCLAMHYHPAAGASAASCHSLPPPPPLTHQCTATTCQVRVALVTRNTTASVDAFFSVIGEEWRGLFRPVLTREHVFVKPDKRLLLGLAQEWGLHPGRLLMVGDSFEDVEVRKCGPANSAYASRSRLLHQSE